MVECTALEMRHRCKPIGGSNPSLSATKSGNLFNKLAFPLSPIFYATFSPTLPPGWSRTCLVLFGPAASNRRPPN